MGGASKGMIKSCGLTPVTVSETNSVYSDPNNKIFSRAQNNFKELNYLFN
jgi:hypothetical protein